MSRTVERMEEIAGNGDAAEAMKLLFKIIRYFNEEQADAFEEFYHTLDEIDQINLYNDIVDESMNIHIPPMLWENSIYDKIKRVYAENEWIKPYKVYINKFGRYIEMLNEIVTGSMYIMKLKQSAKKGLSVRSTGHISHRGLPEKTKRSHKESYSKTPIRFGGDENSNMNIGVDSEHINVLHMFHRSSIHGRQTLAEHLTTFMHKMIKGDDEVETVTLDELIQDTDNLTNRNVEILNAYMKILGIKLTHKDPDRTLLIVDEQDRGEYYELKDGTMIQGSYADKVKGDIRIDVIRKLQKNTRDIRILTSDEYNAIIDAEVERIYNSK